MPWLWPHILGTFRKPAEQYTDDRCLCPCYQRACRKGKIGGDTLDYGRVEPRCESDPYRRPCRHYVDEHTRQQGLPYLIQRIHMVRHPGDSAHPYNLSGCAGITVFFCLEDTYIMREGNNNSGEMELGREKLKNFNYILIFF